MQMNLDCIVSLHYNKMWFNVSEINIIISLSFVLFYFLLVTVYEVHVITGELWNAGTEADVYISIYGENGDTGSRQLRRSKKPTKFLKGQVSDRSS